MWQFSAACDTQDTEIFFSELRSKVTKAKAICATCPVRSQCLSFAIAEDIDTGIFGGLTPAERKELLRPKSNEGPRAQWEIDLLDS
jgi:WhiB family redox-sensing transcriptional regulator